MDMNSIHSDKSPSQGTQSSDIEDRYKTKADLEELQRTIILDPHSRPQTAMSVKESLQSWEDIDETPWNHDRVSIPGQVLAATQGYCKKASDLIPLHLTRLYFFFPANTIHNFSFSCKANTNPTFFSCESKPVHTTPFQLLSFKADLLLQKQKAKQKANKTFISFQIQKQFKKAKSLTFKKQLAKFSDPKAKAI